MTTKIEIFVFELGTTPTIPTNSTSEFSEAEAAGKSSPSEVTLEVF